MEWNGIEIDEQMAMVLDSIRQHDGTATTSEVKRDTPFEHNNSVKYRFRKLESAGIVTIEDQGIDEETGRRLPLHVELTEDGRELVEEYDIHAESVREQQSIETRVTRLEQQMDTVFDDVWQVKTDVLGLREDVDRIMDALELHDSGEDAPGDEDESRSSGATDVSVDSEELDFGR